MKMHMKNFAGPVAAVAILAGMALATTPETAQADPGNCGVSVEGPSNTGMGWAYFVKNVCSDNINVKVHLDTVDQYTPCHWIVPGETVPLSSNYIDQTWEAVPC